jgi:hypothetical protein
MRCTPAKTINNNEYAASRKLVKSKNKRGYTRGGVVMGKCALRFI